MDEPPATGKRAFVTVLFCDLCDYTALAEAIDPQEVDALKHQLEEISARIIHKQDGAISQVYGDGILAVFGFPRPLEKDARRAVEAALRIHEETRHTRFRARLPRGFEVRMHSGIHAGLAFVRRGDTVHGRYELTGDVVNTASRLCGAAQRDEILISTTALPDIEAFFKTEPASRLPLKGKRVPVTACRVLERVSLLTRSPVHSQRGLTTFVNRHAELQQLERVLEMGSSRRTLVVVTGAVGIGKTRLLDEFVARHDAKRVTAVRGWCDSYAEIPPLTPFLQIVRQMSDDDAGIAKTIEQRLGPAGEQFVGEAGALLRRLSSTIDGAAHAQGTGPAVIRAVTGLIDRLAVMLPLTVVLDDWQWADDASRAVLTELSRNPDAFPGSIVIGMRGSPRADPTLRPDRVLSLEPFEESASQQVVGGLTTGSIDLGLTAALHQRSGGNPLFLEELCRSLPEGAYREDSLQGGNVPDTLRGVIHARVAALPVAQATLLRTASVIGIEFSTRLLSEVMGSAPAADALEALVRQGLIHGGQGPQTYRFKHGLTREAVYESVLIEERRRVHAAVAAALKSGVDAPGGARTPEVLAYHYRGSEQYQDASHNAELAGDRAMMTPSLDLARFHYMAALKDLDELAHLPWVQQHWLVLCAKWARPFVYSPSRKDLSMFDRAVAIARQRKDNLALAGALHWRGWAHYVLGDYGDSIAHSTQALALAQGEDDAKLVAQLWANLGQSHAAAGRYPEALSHFERGLSLKRSLSEKRGRGGALAQGFAYAMACRAVAYADRGDFAAADEDLRNALEVVTGTGHEIEGSVLGLQCIVLLMRGAWEEAEATAGRTRATAERASSAYSFAMSLAFEAYAGWMSRREPASITHMERAIRWLENREIGLFSSFNYGCLADALCSCGETERAQDCAHRALARAECGDPLGEAMACCVMARIEAAGDGPGATRWLDRARKSARARDSVRELAMVDLVEAELAARRGEREHAMALAEGARAAFVRMEAPGFADRAERLHAEQHRSE